MAAFRISHEVRPEPTPKAKARKNASYLDFIRQLQCCVTGARGMTEAAHLSTQSGQHGHYGRGKGSKVSDRWVLPLSADAHRQQHSMNETAFWSRAEIDPHLLALVLFGLWSEHGDDALPFAEAVINQRLAAVGRLRERELS